MRSICCRLAWTVIPLILVACMKEPPRPAEVQKRSSVSTPQTDTASAAGAASRRRAPATSGLGCLAQIKTGDLPPACQGPSAMHYQVLVAGQPAGRAVLGELTQAGVVTSCQQVHMVLRRGPVVMESTTTVVEKEHQDGTPIGFWFANVGAGLNRQACGQVVGKKLEIESRVSDRRIRKTVTLDGQPRFSFGQKLAMTQLIEQGRSGDSKMVNMFDPESLEVREMTILLVKVAGSGAQRQTEIKTTVSRGLVSMVTTYLLDHEMMPIKSETVAMGLKFEMQRLAGGDETQEIEPVELFTRSFIAAPSRLGKKERSGRLTYHLRAVSPDGTLVLPAGPAQRVVVQKGEVQVTVNGAGAPPAAKTNTPLVSEAQRKFLGASAYIESDAPLIQRLAQKAAGGDDHLDQFALAKRIERFVHGYITDPTLQVGYATALQTARDRRGDCTEYALLTAALCRASGMPARIVFGVVYVDHFSGVGNGKKAVFGGHAWTQAFVGGRWVDLDAAQNGFDAGHLALDYNDGDPTGFFALVNTMGAFTIDEVTVASPSP